MKLSKLLFTTTKEIPNDANMTSHILLLRAGYMKQVANGIYSLSTLAQRACFKIENIIREEMNILDGQEVKFPVVMPKELWDMSGRYSSIGSEMVRFTDRVGRNMLLGMTHEEPAVHLAKNWANSYNELPFMIYQIQTKFRDEPRSRGGLIRVREFTMKDAYSFHTTQEDLENFYYKMHEAYERIYNRIGLKNSFISVKSDSGMFGGSISHEFMFLNQNGEDELIICNNCDYRANQEVAECFSEEKEKNNSPQELKEVFTGEAKEIKDVCDALKINKEETVKAVVYGVKGNENEAVLCFTRGDREINETKLRKICGEDIFPYDAKEDKRFCAGNIGPIGLRIENCKIYFDLSLKNATNMCCGANKEGYHYTGFDMNRDLGEVKFNDISKVNDGDLCPKCHNPLHKSNGIEIGNIFQLGTKYTKSMGMTIQNELGENINPIMGCYGIGIGRALACIIEKNSDKDGVIMPMSVAPFLVHITPIRYDNDEVKSATDKIYELLKQNNIETLLDDRNVSTGVKFSDADLLGMPIRLVISPRNLENSEVEVKIRKTGEMKTCKIDQLLETVTTIIKNQEI